jgi:hypothetical protein
MKRIIAWLLSATCLATVLSGCIVVPEGGYYHHHHHDYYDRY